MESEVASIKVKTFSGKAELVGSTIDLCNSIDVEVDIPPKVLLKSIDLWLSNDNIANRDNFFSKGICDCDAASSRIVDLTELTPVDVFGVQQMGSLFVSAKRLLITVKGFSPSAVTKALFAWLGQSGTITNRKGK